MQKKYEERIVAFIDILGFKNIVEHSNKAFEIMDIIIESKKFYQKVMYEVSEQEIKVTMFSDCIVISSPASIGYLHFLLDILKNMQAELIQMGILIRGGIEIGDCFHEKETLFGPAMNKSYELENNVANVPRIVLSKYLIEYINKWDLSEEKALELKHNEDINFYYGFKMDGISESYNNYETTSSEIYNKFILEDSDGYYFLNYLESVIGNCTHTKSYEQQKVYNTDGSIHETTFDAHDTFSDDMFSGVIVPLQKLIKKNLKGNSMSIKLKYLWLQEYYNRSIDREKQYFSKGYGEKFLSKLYLR
ncbi:hypothetical protein [Sporosarcina sp. FA9]|uniref:hypothetical protein n=1 Tax=Sporosarcina sp. FA9 TaxID=3413030 RepID=UPI003F65FED9